MNALQALWKFSRPHTIIGSLIGIFTLFYIICDKLDYLPPLYLFLALSIGVTCNIFIVGINQIADVEIDKINKPYLPIPSGILSVQGAKAITFGALFISLSMALYASPYLFLIIALAAAVGWAYSMPPFYLKKHHITAALAITIVRGVLLNAGGFLVFNYLINGTLNMSENVKILTLFIIVFSIVISWFKDLPDMAGDAAYNIKTFAILYSPKFALIAGNLLVGSAYLFSLVLKWNDYLVSETTTLQTKILFYGHLLLFVLFIVNAFSIKLTDHQSIKKFYMRFWWFFFAEYVLYLLAYAIK